MLSLLRNLQVEPLPLVQAVPERCLRRRLSTCDCRLCLDVCGAGAISPDRGQLQLDQKRCTGCMACVAVCPNEALATSYDLEGILRAVRGKAEKRPVISCIRQKRRSVDEIAVPCLGIFSEEALVALGRSDCRSIEFDLGGCSVCENRQAAMRFLAIFRRVKELAAPVLFAELAISEITPPETAKEGTDRRSFFAELRGKLPTLSLISPDIPESAPSQQEKNRRRLPMRPKLIDRLIADAAAVSDKQQLLTLCTHRVTTGPACTCCPLCTGICPTGALRVSGSGTAKRLLFTGTRCSGCGLCVLFCRKKAIALVLSPLSGRSEKQDSDQHQDRQTYPKDSENNRET